MIRTLCIFVAFSPVMVRADLLDHLKNGRIGSAVGSVFQNQSSSGSNQAELFYKKGAEHVRKFEWDSAIPMFRAAAEQGHVKTGYALGRFAQQGISAEYRRDGYKVDYRTAQMWYSWAVKKETIALRSI